MRVENLERGERERREREKREKVRSPHSLVYYAKTQRPRFFHGVEGNGRLRLKAPVGGSGDRSRCMWIPVGRRFYFKFCQSVRKVNDGGNLIGQDWREL